jgi:hypothetical protein
MFEDKRQEVSVVLFGVLECAVGVDELMQSN